MEVLRDYAIRGLDLEGMALFDFILNTHEGTHRRQDPLVFVPYLAGSHKQDKGQLVQVSTDKVVLEIFGGWPPALQQTDDKGLYEASMLLLFNPWETCKISKVVMILLREHFQCSKV
jgi:hypothetical protein